MQPKSDAQLLRDYAERGADTAFTELVQRHTNLVYSATLRQVESPAIAAEITQNVFISLAHGAKTLAPRLAAEASLAGWLCRCARNLSLNHRRDEFRRATRERQAMEQLITLPDAAPDWDKLRRVLDDAMAELAEADYDALVLRYFQDRDFHAVGAAIGVSDDTAQKRVTRALDKLRDLLAQRGIRTTAGALGLAITAHAVQAAPVGLAVTISAVALAGTAVTTSTLIAATKTIAMTTLQKTVITAAFVAAAGAGIFEARQAAQLREQNQTLQQSQAPLAEQIQKLQNSFTDATNRLADLLAENSRLKSNPHETELLKLRGTVTQLKMAQNDPAETAAKSWAKRVAQLKQHLDQNPEAKIPELKYINDDTWLNAASGSLETEKDYRRAFSNLRHAGENSFIIEMQKALSKYLQANNNQFPSDVSQLKSFFESAPEDAMLQRYAVVPSSSIPNMKLGSDWLITVKEPVDKEYDALWALGDRGFGSSDFKSSEQAKLGEVLRPAFEAYQAANNGHEPQDPINDLRPYLTTPDQLAVLRKLVQMRDAAMATQTK